MRQNKQGLQQDNGTLELACGSENMKLDRSTQRLRALPDRTCIAVTHRPAAIALCDWRLEVRNGRIHVVWVDSREQTE